MEGRGRIIERGKGGKERAYMEGKGKGIIEGKGG